MIYLNGLLLGFSLIMALGPQNIFLIRQGARRKHAMLSALVCFCCDVILVLASITGLHKTLASHPSLQGWITLLGALFLLYYGANALKKSMKGPSPQMVEQVEHSNRLQIILLALGFSLLNPHAIIDTIVIIGSGSSQFPDHKLLFLTGVLSASLVWFASLTCASHYFADILIRRTIWRRIELASGLLMLTLSVKLIVTVF